MQKLHPVYNGTETLSNLAPRLWSTVLHKTRQPVSLGDFKSKIKRQTPCNCPWRLRKSYFKNLTLASSATFSTIIKQVFKIFWFYLKHNFLFIPTNFWTFFKFFEHIQEFNKYCKVKSEKSITMENISEKRRIEVEKN